MKKVLITGASKGIGKSIAIKLLTNNYSVIGISRTHSINHKNYHPIIFDLTKLGRLKKIINEILAKHKKIDTVISNAGNGIFDNLENIPLNKIEGFFNLNLIAPVLISKFLIGHFKKNNKGQFIFLGSEAGQKAIKKSTLYATAKFGLNGFANSFKDECNKRNIRVTILNPGMVRSTFFNELRFKPGSSKKNAINKNDLADLVLFLCSDESSFITGSNYSIDGGFITLNSK